MEKPGPFRGAGLFFYVFHEKRSIGPLLPEMPDQDPPCLPLRPAARRIAAASQRAKGTNRVPYSW